MEWEALITLGVLLAAALLAGGLGEFFRLPKVTSYLLAGVALGAMVPEHITEQLTKEKLIHEIEPLTKLAMALVLFTLGCHFPLSKARRILRRVSRLSTGELVSTFVVVSLGVLVLGASWEMALLLGALALATAPATTILVLKETESEGPVTEYTNAMVAINNLASIIIFELLLIGILFYHGQADHPPIVQLWRFASDIVGSALLGVVAGLAISVTFGLVSEIRRLVLLVAAIALVLGVCLWLEMPYLLTFLLMGMTVANSSYQTRQLLSELDRLTGLLCVVFFVTHGAELQLDKLRLAGAIGAGYLVLRCVGKYLGTRIAANSINADEDVRNWLGSALLAQAGAAITLSAIAVRQTQGMEGPLPKMCEEIQTIILGTVVVFEIAGPLLIRNAVMQAGEVPLSHAVHRPGVNPFEQIRSVFNSIMLSLGKNPWGATPKKDLVVSDLMRRNIKGVPQSATFDAVIEQLEHRRDNSFPVVDKEDRLVGLIRYRELSSILFDDELGSLVRAADITTPAGNVLHPEDPVDRAGAMFAAIKDDCIPVIASEEPHVLLGIVRRRDLMKFQILSAGDNTGK